MVRRRTAWESLLQVHATPQTVAFRLQQTGEDVGALRERHEAVTRAAQTVLGRVPTVWRKTWVLRSDLDQFRFDPEDIVVAVGLDGLVPNVAKYLTGQPVIGVNPTSWDQRMMHFREDDMAHLYASGGDLKTEARTMVQVTMDDGRSIAALNELFCGHQSHQSAKYEISFAGTAEYQSSSGLLVTTGTGATGWARSISEATGVESSALPTPTDRGLYFMVREAWASSFTGSSLVRGALGAGQADETLSIVSRMETGGVIFGDGIESDALPFGFGNTATFGVCDRSLNLVIPS